MASSVRVHGASGVVRWGYHPAATLGAWTITASPDRVLLLTAAVQASDALRIAQRPLTFAALIAGRTLTWPLVSVSISGSQLTGTLGTLGT